MAPRRSRRKHKPLDDSSSISSGGTSGNGLTYTMPTNYRTKSQKPSLVERTQTKQLSKLPLPPPRPRRYHSSARSMSSTVASETTYTSRVSKVSIHSREPVLNSNDPLARAMQDTIAQSGPPGNKPLPHNRKHSPPENVSQSAPPGGASPAIIEAVPAAPVSSSTGQSGKGGPVVLPPPPPLVPQSPPESATQSALPEGVPTIIEAVPTTQVNSTGTEQYGKLPPPPPFDSLETYSFATNDSPRKMSIAQERRNWRRLVCLISIVLLVVVAGAVVVSVVLVVGNKDDNGGGREETTPSSLQAPTRAPSLRPSTTATTTTQQQVPTAVPAFAPILPPTGGTDITVPNLEQLIDYFSDKSPGTALVLLDPTSPEYRAMQWLAEDVEQNSFTLTQDELRILQRGVLSMFYYSTLGEEQWTDRTGWLDSTLSECEWIGTECRQGEGTILSLVLGGNEFGGKIPRELFLMESLEQVTLSKNQIGSTIPTSIGQGGKKKNFIDAN